MDIYRQGIAPILFYGLKTDPEWIHHQTINFLSWLGRRNQRPPARWIQSLFADSCCLEDQRLHQNLWGLDFSNPVGLAAGFDKDGVAAGVWGSFGFGFAELGSCTFHPQPGNPQPRLFRLPDDQAILNRMGFNNQGAAEMAVRLSQRQQLLNSGSDFPIIPIGINIGKSKITALENAPQDYLGSFRLLKDLGDYFVVNVSSPNTPGLRSLQDASQLSLIFDVLQQENQGIKPILVKIAPDLEWEAIGQVVEVAKSYQLSGIIATNTTVSRDNLQTDVIAKTGKSVKDESGGISGAPLRRRSTEVIEYIYSSTGGKMKIIGCGGVFTAEDAWEKITAGASILQVYTGLVYEGPWMVRGVLEGLLEKLKQHNLSHISEAVGLSVMGIKKEF
jgi:dihydroorotate dehydrogenase